MNRLKNLSVKMQISLPILILSVLIAAVGLKSLLTINSVIARTDVAISHLSPATISILNADRDLYQAELALREYVVLTGEGQPVAAAQQQLHQPARQAPARCTLSMCVAVRRIAGRVMLGGRAAHTHRACVGL